jgi:hypothetical protein
VITHEQARMARIRRLVQTSFDSRAPKGELQLTGRVKYAGMAVFGPRIMARISTVTRIPCARCLLKPVRARPEVHRDPLAVASRISARSEVMSTRIRSKIDLHGSAERRRRLNFLIK